MKRMFLTAVVVLLAHLAPAQTTPGYISTAPTRNQTINQPSGTSMSVNTFNNAQYAQNVTQLAAMVATGGTIRVANGTYVLSGDLSVPSNTTIECDSWAADITMPGVSGTHNIFNLTGASNVRIIGCNIDGTGMTASGANSFTVYAPDATNVELSGNWIHDSPEDCVRLGSNSTGVEVPTSARVTDNYFSNCGTIGPSGSFVGAESAQNLVIANNIGDKSLLDGIDIEPDTGGSPSTGAVGNDIVIVGNVLQADGASSNGISLFNTSSGTGSRAVIASNTINGYTGGSGIFVSGGWTNVALAADVVQGSVIGLDVDGSSPIHAAGLVLTSDTTGIVSNGIGATGNTFEGTITGASTGINETNGADANSYGVTFVANTANVGTLNGNSTLRMTQANGTYGIEIPGSLKSFYLQNGSNTFNFYPGNLTAGAFNTQVETGDYGSFCLGSPTCSMFFGNASYGFRLEGTTGKVTFQAVDAATGYRVGGSAIVMYFVGSLTTTASASDTLTASSVPAGAACSVQAQNSTAAGLTGVYVPLTASAGSVVVDHSATADAIYSVFCQY